MTQHPSESSPSVQDARVAAVSLVEVLTVISIIALLLALLVPSLSHAREQARRVSGTIVGENRAASRTNLLNRVRLPCLFSDKLVRW